MDSLCRCFHVPKVKKNVKSSSSNLKTEYGQLPNNQNITPEISSGMIMQPGSNSGVTSKKCYPEFPTKLPGKVLMKGKVGHLNSISEEEEVCQLADQKEDTCRPAFKKKIGRRLCRGCHKEFAHPDHEMTTQCGHKYHFKCMYQWLEKGGKCPACAEAADGV